MFKMPSEPAVLSVYAVSRPGARVSPANQCSNRLLTIISGPRVGAIAACPVCEAVQDTLVWVLLRAEEDEMLESMRTSSVVEDLGCNNKVTVGLRATTRMSGSAQTSFAVRHTIGAVPILNISFDLVTAPLPPLTLVVADDHREARLLAP